MINSMTAFTRQTDHKEWGSVICEVRTVNHRYLDLDIRLPEQLREIEMSLRELITKYLRRGRVEFHIKLHSVTEPGTGFSLNRDLVDQLSQARYAVREMWQEPLSTSVTDLLAWPGVLQSPEINKEAMHRDLLTLFEKALQDIVKMRRSEGEALAQRLTDRCNQIVEEVNVIRERLPIVLKLQREKVRAKVEEIQVNMEAQRMEEEILLFMQKMDIAEEVERLEIHVEAVHETMKTEESTGRRLDFLMQEMHRESNTIGSKCVDTEVTHSALRLKVLVEQMREQVQNVE